MQLPKILIASLLLLFAQVSLAQKRTITGTVTDSSGTPLEGVSIKLKSKTGGMTTSRDGTFSIQAEPSDVLLISSVGFASTSYTIGDQTNIHIMLQTAATDLGEIVLIGTRTAGRIKTESPVPVDVIHINQAEVNTARSDITSVLNYTAPSFNYNKQSGADGADHIDLGTLRGLGPDQTLVLINGKRRHQTAFVALFGTRGRGNSGADLKAFPGAAVDRIEILRDGASAQYGSDAMAGVINIILRKDINHWNINAGWAGYDDDKYNPNKVASTGQYYTGNKIDGNTFTFSIDNGFALGHKGGFINIAADFLSQGKTFREVLDTNVKLSTEALPVNYLRRAFGDASLITAGIMYNMEVPTSVSRRTTFYSFGGYNYKFSDAYAYTRNQDNTSRFPVDANGNIIYDPSIMRKTADGEIYYNPHIQTHIQDASMALGLKGGFGNEWTYDLSNTLGRNDFNFFGDKTYNASLGLHPNHFDDGGFNFLQNTVNLDLSKPIKTVAHGLNLGIGAEYRYERYAIYAGEDASWKQYPNTTGQAAGSQGFPGFRPADAIQAHRSNIGLYVDAELNVTNNWLLDGALRGEHYSDFGDVVTYKLATRYKLASNFNIRGSISSGYRAPSLQQINFSNTLTTFVGNELKEEKVARNGDPITNAAGIPALKQETSVNGSVGFAWVPTRGLTFTVDGYIVKVKNRIVLSGLFSADDGSLPPALTDELQRLNVALAQFFANAVTTTNKGIDIIIDYNKILNTQRNFRILLAGNFQHMNINDIHVPDKLNDSYLHRKTFFSDREEAFLKASAPNSKVSLNLEYNVKKFGVGAHITYFGDVKLLGFGYTGLASAAGTGGPGDPAISGSFTGIDPYVDIDGYNDQIHVLPEVFNYSGKVATDIFGSYRLSKKAAIYIGCDNLFNVHPELGAVPHAQYEAFDNESGGPWDSVQMGFNGRRLFAKVSLNF